MFQLNLQDTLSVIVASMAVLGVVALATGIFILFRKVMGDELKVIASQTTRLAQKGIAEEITGPQEGDDTLLAHLVGERATVQPLHDHVDGTVGHLIQIEDTGNVRMLDVHLDVRGAYQITPQADVLFGFNDVMDDAYPFVGARYRLK